MTLLRPALFVALAAFVTPAPARAGCNDGGWFCEPGTETPPETSETPASGGAAEPAAPATPGPSDSPSREPAPPPPGSKAWPPRVYDPPTFRLKRATPSKRKRKKPELGFNTHLSLAYLGNSPHQHSDALMGGIGGAFRFRPVPVVAIDAGLELIGGNDWNGDERFEAALVGNALLFFNPRHRLQIYGIVGLGVSNAFIEREVAPGEFRERQEAYFGGQIGLGGEGRITRKTAISLDFLGFLRERAHRRWDRPEYVDPKTHQATDVSAGGLIRLGATFYF